MLVSPKNKLQLILKIMAKVTVIRFIYRKFVHYGFTNRNYTKAFYK
jgi:hypothetical protein